MSLIFLTPLALIGLLGLAVPIYLHMRHRPRAVSYRFSAFEFLLHAQKKRQKHLKVEQFLLMLMRLMILALLVFLFARPFRETLLGTVSSQGPVIFILDDSASMLAEHQGTVFQQALDAIADMIEKVPMDQEAYLLLASDPTAHDEVRSIIDIKRIHSSLKPTTRRATLDDAYNRALDIIASEKFHSATIEILTDNRLNAWLAPPQKPDSHIQVHLNTLQVPKENIGIVHLRPLTGSTQASGFEVQVFNSSSSRNPVSLELQAQGQQWHESLPLSPHSTTTHRFTLDEHHMKTVSFNLPADAFTLDNRQVFPVKTYSTPNILIVDGDPNPIPENSESYYFRTVLGGINSPKNKEPFRLITSAGLNKERMQWADVIIMLNVDEPPVSVCSQALSAGKGLFISCGNRVLPASWNPFLKNAGMELWEWTSLPEAFPLELRESPNQIASSLRAGDLSLFFGDTAIRKNQITTIQSSKMETIMALPDGSPLLLAGHVGNGRLLLWTSSMDLDGSNLPLQIGFVPLIQNMIDYLFFREQQIELELTTVSDILENDMTHQLVLIENWTTLKPDEVNGPLPGLYRTTIDGQSHNLAIQLDPEESDFQLQEQGETGQDGFLPSSFQKKARLDLGHPLAWVLFIIILLETGLAARVTQKWGNK